MGWAGTAEETDNEFNFGIPLKPWDAVKDSRDSKEEPEPTSTVDAEECCIHYLEHLGLSPTPKNIAAVRSNLPLDKRKAQVSYRNRGGMLDQLSVTVPKPSKRIPLAGEISQAPRMDKPTLAMSVLTQARGEQEGQGGLQKRKQEQGDEEMGERIAVNRSLVNVGESEISFSRARQNHLFPFAQAGEQKCVKCI